MDDRQSPASEGGDEGARREYEPPVVEELDTTFGPSVTAAGITTLAAPRDL